MSDDHPDRQRMENYSLIEALRNGPIEALPDYRVRYYKELVRDSRPEVVHHLSCPCGCEEVELDYGITEDDGMFPRWVVCPECSRKAGGRFSTKMAVLAWEWMLDNLDKYDNL